MPRFERFRCQANIGSTRPWRDFQPFARARYLAINISGCPGENPSRRQAGTLYILWLRDFEILGARELKRDKGERLIFLAA
jgi:hypothetical protein